MEISDYEYDYRATAALGLAIEVLREIVQGCSAQPSATDAAEAALTRIMEIVPEFNVTKSGTRAAAGDRNANE